MFDFLAGSGEMATLTRRHDWAATPLGAPAQWPASLKTAMRLLLTCHQPMLVWWGPDLIQFYNDAYRQTMGPERHPSALGQPARECWMEAWHIIGPQIDAIMTGHEHEGRSMPVTRDGRPEDAWRTCDYAPITDESGVRGVLVMCSDVSEQRRSTEELRRLNGALAAQAIDWQRLHAMSGPLLRAGTLREQLSIILDTAIAFHGCKQGLISLFDADAGGLVAQASIGIGADGLSGLTWVAVGDGADGRAFAERRRIIVEDVEAEPIDGRYRLLARAQGIRAVCSTPLSGADGKALGVLSVYFPAPRRPDERELQLADLCARHAVLFIERAREQEVPSDSETRLRQLANTIPQLAWMANADGWIHWYNDRWYDYTGTTPAQMEGWGWQSVHDPLRLPDVMKEWTASIATGEPFETSFPLRAANGEFHTFFTRAAPLRDASGKIMQWFGTNTDVTPLEQAEKALRDSEERLREGLLAGSMAVWDWDIARGKVNFSANAEVLFGQAWDDAATGWDMVHPDDLPRLHAAAQRAIEARSSYNETVRMIRPDSGDVIWMDVRGKVMCDDAGKPLSVRGISLDITERKKAEEELRRADRQKDEFLAMLAHELRNPLAPISAAAELLKLARLDERRLRDTSDIIARQAAHMTSLINDLLDMSRVTRGLVSLDMAPLDLKDIVVAAVEQVRSLIDARRHRLSVQMPTERMQVQGDRVRLVQVVSNLLNNAAKYTPEGGDIALSMQASDGLIALQVRDSGIGIAPELLSRVFDLFAQGDRSADRSQGGLGLGLALVKGLMELHGGDVSVRSDGLGKGSEFLIRLARLGDTPHADRPAAKALPEQAGGKRLSVMIVDDNADAAHTLAMLMEAGGHDVRIAHDAKNALEQLAQAGADAPRVFILDIGLPGMDGHELARRLRRLPATGRACLIALTGYGQKRDRERSAAAGFDHHMVKPVDNERLARLLASLD